MALRRITGKASKVGGAKGIEPLVPDSADAANAQERVNLRQESQGYARKTVTTDNGSVANPIKGTKVAGAAKLTGGRF